MTNNAKVVDFTIKELLDCGAHFGHRTNYWNPEMSKYIYGIRNNTHIFDLRKTAYSLNYALGKIREVASQNGKILFVGTKKQAQEAIAHHAKRCGQFYVNHRWLGGMMTNWETISASIKKLSQYEEMLENPNLDITKKERLGVERKHEKLDKVLGGIRTLGGRPDLLFVVDCRNESLAVMEAKKLGIPVIGVVDSNTNPNNVDYVIPANDDAVKAISFYCSLASDAALKGLELSLNRSGAQLSAEELIKLHQDSQQKAKNEAEKKKSKTSPKGKPVAVEKVEKDSKSEVKVESKDLTTQNSYAVKDSEKDVKTQQKSSAKTKSTAAKKDDSAAQTNSSNEKAKLGEEKEKKEPQASASKPKKETAAKSSASSAKAKGDNAGTAKDKSETKK